MSALSPPFPLHRFPLENGKVLCSDPDLPWTKRAMRKVDEEAERKRNHRPDSPQEGTGGFQKTTMLPLTSRWPQVPTSVAILMKKPRADSAPKPQRGPRRRIKIIKTKRKDRNKGGKRKRTYNK